MLASGSEGGNMDVTVTVCADGIREGGIRERGEGVERSRRWEGSERRGEIGEEAAAEAEAETEEV